jgi:hypothetical protein
MIGYRGPQQSPLFGLAQPTPPMGDLVPPGAAVPAQAFQWGEGGGRLTPEDIAMRRKMAMQNIAAGSDYSPVQHWTQGLARVAQALVGGMENRKLDKAAEQNATAEQQILASLTNRQGGGNAAAAALGNPYLSDGVRKVAEMQFQAANRAPPAPHYFETNNGSQGVIGPDGVPKIIYDDPTPKINWITSENPDGTKTLVPMGPDGPLQKGGDSSLSVPRAPVGKLTPIGGAGSGPRTFP